MLVTIQKEVLHCRDCPYYSIYEDMGASTPICEYHRDDLKPVRGNGIPIGCPEFLSQNLNEEQSNE